MLDEGWGRWRSERERTVVVVEEAMGADLDGDVGFNGDAVVGMILRLSDLQLLLMQVEHFVDGCWAGLVVVAVAVLYGIDISVGRHNCTMLCCGGDGDTNTYMSCRLYTSPKHLQPHDYRHRRDLPLQC